MNTLKDRIAAVSETITDEPKRIKLQFIWTYRILGWTAAFMTFVNIFTDKTALMFATLIFSVLSLLNILIARHSEKGLHLSKILFSIEIFVLFIFFIITGTPEGFSVIWLCMLPTSGLLLFGRKNGTILCSVLFVIIIFFFQTPWGNSFLQFSYTPSFRLRFPMLYVSFYAVSYFLETVRALTQQKLEKTQKEYQYLYLHDALTGVYNRYGFNQKLNAMVAEAQDSPYSLSILDIDHFKNINDSYGHISGDTVLKKVAAKLVSVTDFKADVCRWGGEEFAVMIRGDMDIDKTVSILISSIDSMMIKSDNSVMSVTVSAGTVRVPAGIKADPAKLVNQADHCLYRAKDSGRDRAVSENYIA